MHIVVLRSRCCVKIAWKMVPLLTRLQSARHPLVAHLINTVRCLASLVEPRKLVPRERSHGRVYMPSTTWRQTDEELTLRVALPAGATHESVRLVLKRQRLSLLHAPDAKQRASVLLRRRLAAAIEPQRTSGYAIHDGLLVVVLHKAHPGGWARLFATADRPSAGAQSGLGHAASQVLGGGAARAIAGRAPERCHSARASTRHAWRSPVRSLPSTREACGPEP